MSVKKILCLLLAILMLATSFAGCSQSPSRNQKEFQSFEDFESAKLGVLTGSEYDRQTQVIFPNSEMFQYYDFIDLLLSLEADKIDGFLTDSAFYSAIGWEREGYKAIQSDKTTPVVQRDLPPFSMSQIFISLAESYY